MKYLIESNEKVYAFESGAFTEVGSAPATEELFQEKGMTSLDAVTKEAWNSLPRYDILKWVEGVSSIQSEIKEMTVDTEIGENFLLKTTISPVDYPLGIYQVKEKRNGPGPISLIAGDEATGFYGEVPANDFITGDALASMLGLTSGASQNSDEPWLKFSIDGKTIFKSKKPFRNSISWNHIHAVNAVYGDRIITIEGNDYKVRLMRGAENDPSQNNDSDKDAMKSEWNRLMLPIHIEAKNKNWAYPNYVESDIPDWGIGYTDQDLLTHSDFGNGSYQWCQETVSSSASHRVLRGRYGASYSNWSTSSSAYAHYGWSPVLELI